MPFFLKYLKRGKLSVRSAPIPDISLPVLKLLSYLPFANFLTKLLCLQDNKTRKKPKFIVHDDEDIDANYSSDEDHDDLFDNVCAYCDDGGNVLG